MSKLNDEIKMLREKLLSQNTSSTVVHVRRILLSLYRSLLSNYDIASGGGGYESA